MMHRLYLCCISKPPKPKNEHNPYETLRNIPLTIMGSQGEDYPIEPARSNHPTKDHQTSGQLPLVIINSPTQKIIEYTKSQQYAILRPPYHSKRSSTLRRDKFQNKLRIVEEEDEIV